MSPAALVETLRARGVTLEVHGDRLKVRPATAVTPDEVEKLRQHKTEVLRLLAPAPAATPVSLDRVTIREVLGPDTDDPHAVACVRFEVVATVRELKAGIRAGVFPPRRLVHGRPLCDWLSLDDVARLLRAGDGNAKTRSKQGEPQL